MKVIVGAAVALASFILPALASDKTSPDPTDVVLDPAKFKQCEIDVTALEIVTNWTPKATDWWDVAAMQNFDITVTRETHDFYVTETYDEWWLGVYCKKPQKDTNGKIVGTVHCCSPTLGWVHTKHVSTPFKTKSPWYFDQCVKFVQDLINAGHHDHKMPQIHDSNN